MTSSIIRIICIIKLTNLDQRDKKLVILTIKEF